jgi:predicted nucleotide-binding protein (sugar kinase/HSP70/actin superfamily)
VRVTVPRFGLLSIALSHLFRKLEFDFLPAPSITPASWDRSLTLSPEQICLPFKYNMANYLDCLNLGVDTIFIAGGHGPCRFGLYGFLQGKLLSAVEEKLRFVVINQDNILEFIDECATSCGFGHSSLKSIPL